MRIQEFTANTATEALNKVREVLGERAIIVSTKPNGFAGGVIVTAAVPNPGESIPAARKREFSIAETLRELRTEVAELRDSIASGKSETLTLAPGIEDLDRRLRDNGVAPRLRRRIVETSARRALGTEILAVAEQVIGDVVPVWPIKPVEKKPRILSFIGPTGAGKTTSLAKLAGRLVYEAKKKVGLITFDTYRVAAVEQIRAYADMMAVPLSVGFTPADAARLLEDFQDRDVVLIDTAGRSPYDSARLRELAGFLNSGSEIENLLVISATTSPDVAEEIMDRFAIAPEFALVITKLDECKKPGALFELIVERDVPIAYLANGQEVPRDLERASMEKISDLLLKEAKPEENLKEVGL